MIPLRFTEADVDQAHAAWGCNCGPAAAAAVLGMTLDEIRPHLGDFEAKRYTNPTLMLGILKRLRPGRFEWKSLRRDADDLVWPRWGLARIQWDGPWCEPGVPAHVAYRHTHWVGVAQRGPDDVGIFDVNAMNSGGWISARDWIDTLVPWLLKECVPRAGGDWWKTHVVEVRV